MTTTMESPVPYDDSPLDADDVVYPCKGCGDILEEGKAFELAGNRWHIDCFRCHTCGTLLDSDANLLLLGDGSLICNNCTYSCSACGNKIEDLAILTGDQAFCAGCFRCRSCKRKIDNLRYARTSQGIFCMSCHESLMARRRKKAKTKASATSSANAAAPPSDKALPSLPASAVTGSPFAPEVVDSPSESLSGTPRASSPAQRLSSNMQVPSSQRRDRDPSPLSDDGGREGTTLPSSTYQKNRSQESEDGDQESGFLPMAYDPNPAPRGQVPRKRFPQVNDPSPSQSRDQSRDYFEGRGRDQAVSSRSASTEREALHNHHFPSSDPPKLSPHVAYQDKNRQQRRTASGANTPGSRTPAVPSPTTSTHAERDRAKPQPINTSSSTSSDNFSLQDVPKNRKNGTSSRATAGSRQKDDAAAKVSPLSEDDDINPFEDPKLKEASPLVPAPIPTRHADRPARGDSLAASKLASNRSSADPGTPLARDLKPVLPHDRQESVSSVHTMNYSDARNSNGALASPVHAFGSEGPPPRASSRSTAPLTSSIKEDFVAPRAPPQPPTEVKQHIRSTSAQLSEDSSNGGQASPALRSSGLPRLTPEDGFSMEKEMSRILKGDREEESTSVLRRVSNAVKHGRSFSDRGSLSKIAAANGADANVTSPSTISSSVTSPVVGQDTIESLRIQLRRAHRRITELETEKVGLEEQVNTTTTIGEVNNELKEKRTTMAFLDSQREIVVRELETITHHLEKVKNQQEPLELPKLKSDILEDFAHAMRKLKEHMGGQVEELIRKRNELTTEITDLIAMKDKGFQEYESLSSKNAQLVEMNTQLLHNIQEGFKASRGDAKSNGLGIFHPGARVEGVSSADMRNLNVINAGPSMQNLLHDADGEPATVLPAPQVVDIRKGQAKKFNWRKGGASVAKGVTKGIKGAFANNEKPGIDVTQIGLPYGMTQQANPGSEQSSMYASAKSNATSDRNGQAFGLFGPKSGRTPATAGPKDPGIVIAADPSSLFGSELEARCEYEKRILPNIVMRCIAEVESRGMHTEGIYRKSGGSGQVKSVQAGFEEDANHDISDPDLEIHAVTSALKQYFRKLPTPLITYDVYDSLLDAGSVTDKDRQAIALRQALAELPPHHKGCLEFLIRHLARVMNNERDNLMTPLNLAVVFAPTIMRPLSIEREMSDGLAQRAAVQALLQLHETVFEDE